MKRDLPGMAEKTYDVVVVGGGITGACVARDAALRGLSVALLDKGDFASATTAASSKLIHGGLRYLQNLEVGLVRESLRERRVWSNVASHMIDPIRFLMPTTSKKRIRGRLKMALGLTAYDWLAYDRNRLDDPDKEIPAHKHLSRDETLEAEPGLESSDLTGAMVFYDYQMYSPERLALECILSAVDHGADAANYAQAVDFVKDGARVAGVRVRDCAAAEGAEYAIQGRVVVNAAGPWADILMSQLDEEGPSGRQLMRSKGIHLITRSVTNGHAIAVPSEASHFFILPWRGYSLLGTTDTVYRGDPDKVHVSEKDIIDFLSIINKGYPGAKLARSDVRFFYAGLRPIVDTTSTDRERSEEDPADSYAASRAAEVFDHGEKQGIEGIITAIGGKWTTSRALAERVVDLAIAKLEREKLPCLTEETPTYGGDVGRFAEYVKEVLDKNGALPAAVVLNLAKNYGSRMDDVLALARANPALLEKVSADLPDIAAQVVYAVRNEMALTVEDVVFRRTGLGTLGPPGDHVVQRVGELMAVELGWETARRDEHIDRAVARFTSWARTRAIVNPSSWGNRTGPLWPKVKARLSRAIGPIDTVFTDSPMAATRLTRQALKDGMEQIIAVGGDGTINEVINGFFEDGHPINPEAMLAALTSGTGMDFRRTFDIPETLEDQIARLNESEIRAIDLGKLTYIDEDGQESTRFFGNIASFGLGGAVDRAVNRLKFSKKFGGKIAFQLGVLKGLATYRNQPVRVQVDDTFDEVMNVKVGAVCNGQFFGGGMRVAPNAKPDDGLFDIVVVHDVGLLGFVRHLNKVYRGRTPRFGAGDRAPGPQGDRASGGRGTRRLT